MTSTVNPPLSGRYFTGGFFLESVSKTDSSSGEGGVYPAMAWVGNTFFSVMKIPIVTGRGFNQQDTRSSPRVAIINQALARKFFPNENPIGKRFSSGNRSHLNGAPDRDNTWIQIIGVCADARLGNLRDDPPPMDFQLYSQRPERRKFDLRSSHPHEPRSYCVFAASGSAAHRPRIASNGNPNSRSTG